MAEAQLPAQLRARLREFFRYRLGLSQLHYIHSYFTSNYCQCTVFAVKSLSLALRKHNEHSPGLDVLHITQSDCRINDYGVYEC